MLKKNLSFKKGIVKIESTKLFIGLLFILLLTHIFYDFKILNSRLSIKIIILKSLFFFLIFFTSLLINKYLIKIQKQKYLKYVLLVICMVYLIVNDFVLLNEFDKYKIEPYIDFFMIIFSPIFLSIWFICILSLFILLKYFIVIYFFHAYYLGELIFALITAIFVSVLILFTLKFLIRTVEVKYETRLKEEILLTMEILELKDPYTKGHSERVAKYAKIFAKESQKYTKKTLENFYFACLVHDIGKIGIPDKILNKNSHLTNDEFSIIKKHSLLGSKLLNSLSFTNENQSIIRSHHEKWDGSGYPDGLKGDEIPLNARIVSIADAFDAMTSTRSYRNALSAEEAYKRIIAGAGTQFDPNLIETFKKVYPKWVKHLKNKNGVVIEE